MIEMPSADKHQHADNPRWTPVEQGRDIRQ
jgi:hypothetical protein